SRQLIDRIVNTETFRVVGEVQSVDQLASEIRKGRAYVGLQIPPTFTRDVRAGNPAQVQLLVDGSNSTTALQALNTGLGIALTQSVESLLRETGRHGVPIEIRPQMLYNPAMRSPNFYVPGVIGVALPVTGRFLFRPHFTARNHALDLLRAWRAFPDHLFHLAYARDHSARRAFFRILATPRHFDRDVDLALRSLRPALSEKDRLIIAWVWARNATSKSIKRQRRDQARALLSLAPGPTRRDRARVEICRRARQ